VSKVSEETKASIMALDRDTAFFMVAMLEQLGDDANDALKEIKMLTLNKLEQEHWKVKKDV
tara:strand:+ start:248 stop:430 length:183 start_codon:yes stop_codon:yes gene_type:complete